MNGIERCAANFYERTVTTSIEPTPIQSMNDRSGLEQDPL